MQTYLAAPRITRLVQLVHFVMPRMVWQENQADFQSHQVSNPAANSKPLSLPRDSGNLSYAAHSLVYS
jgi:hypothetical protein